MSFCKVEGESNFVNTIVVYLVDDNFVNGDKKRCILGTIDSIMRIKRSYQR